MDEERKRKLTSTRMRVRKFRAIRKLRKQFEDVNDDSTAENSSNSNDSGGSQSNDDSIINDSFTNFAQNEQADFTSDSGQSVSGDDDSSDEEENSGVENERNDENYRPIDPFDENEPEDDDGPDPPPPMDNADNGHNPEIPQLRKWATQFRIAHAHLDPLLKILRTRLLPDLPASSKTFLGTAGAEYTIIDMEDGNSSVGKFTYLGIEKGLKLCINPNAHEEPRIELQFNCDGLSISKSSSRHIWPILCKVHSETANYEPFVVALYCGESKPKLVEAYARDFISEINILLANGIIILGVNYSVKIQCFVCDTPARAFLKCTKGHTSFNACERCECVGRRVGGTMSFSSVDANLRSNETFRNFNDPDHHNKASPFLLIVPNIDMIKVFVLDFFHLGFLGCSAKLLDNWMSGKAAVKLSQTNKLEISRRLKCIKTQIPHEFQRQTRALAHVPKWKGTEHKLFLQYLGPIVLKHTLRPEVYNNFILMHIVSRLLWSKMTATNIRYQEYAKEYLDQFFLGAINIYGEEFATVNMHHLIHLIDDVKNMNCSLSEINAFPYENELGKIKRDLRSPNRTIAQLCRRLHERAIFKGPATLITNLEIIKEDESEIFKVRYKGSVLTKVQPDNLVLLRNGKILVIKKIFRQEDSIRIKGASWQVKDTVYNNPIESTRLNICELRERPSPTTINVYIGDVKLKMMRLTLDFVPNDRKQVFAIPLLHH